MVQYKQIQNHITREKEWMETNFQYLIILDNSNKKLVAATINWRPA